MAKKKKKSDGKIEVKTVAKTKEKYLEKITKIIQECLKEDYVYDLAAMNDVTITDEKNKELLEQLQKEFSKETLEKLVDQILETGKSKTEKEELTIKEVENLLNTSLSEEYVKELVTKTIEFRLKDNVVEMKKENKEPESEIDQLNREKNEYLEMARRAQADFDNYRKRSSRDMESFKKMASMSLLEKILPVMDALDSATEEAKGNDEKNFEGLSKIGKLLKGVLTKEGLEEIPSLGEEFNPNIHEAVFQDESDDFSVETVTEVMRKGYKIADHIVRATLVKVTIPGPNAPAPEPVVEEVSEVEEAAEISEDKENKEN